RKGHRFPCADGTHLTAIRAAGPLDIRIGDTKVGGTRRRRRVETLAASRSAHRPIRRHALRPMTESRRAGVMPCQFRGIGMRTSIELETLKLRRDGAVVFADVAAPPMNLLGPELVRDLVSLIQGAEADPGVQVLVFTSADPDYFISHVDVTRIAEYRQEA